MTLASLRNKLLYSLLLGLVVVFVLAVYGDLSSVLGVARRFQWEYLPAILGLTLVNYLLRYVKWNFYLGLIEVRTVGKLDSLLMFFSGLSMVMTPGKVGEWLKSFLLRELTGTPFSRSAPIIVAERLTDGLAMALLASGGLVVFGLGWQVLAIVALGAIVIVGITQYRPLALRLIGLAEHLPVVGRRAHSLHEFCESAQVLFRLKNLLIAVGIGVVSWSGECVAFYLVLRGLSGQSNWTLAEGWLPVLQATFTLAVSTLAGSVFLVPGGLGVAEGGLTALGQLLLGLPKDLATVATLLIRFCTLWFGVAIGIVMLFAFSRRLAATARLEMARGNGWPVQDQAFPPKPVTEGDEPRL